MKKLVELDPKSFRTKEFDQKKIHRSAKALREYLLGIAPEDDELHIRDKVLPLVEEALVGKLPLPFDGRNKPLAREGTEGLLPMQYENISGSFWVAIQGMSGLGNDLIKPIHKDGKVYAWMEFEE